MHKIMGKLLKITNLFYKIAAKSPQCEECLTIDQYADPSTEWKCWKCGHKNSIKNLQTIGELQNISQNIFKIIDSIIGEYDLFPNITINERRNKTIEEFKSAITDKIKDGEDIWADICEHIPLTEEFVEYFKDDVDWWWIFEHQDALLNKDFVNKYKDKFIAAGVDPKSLDDFI